MAIPYFSADDAVITEFDYWETNLGGGSTVWPPWHGFSGAIIAGWWCGCVLL